MQSQPRNLFFFFAMVLAVLIGYPILRNKLYPPRPSQKQILAAGQVCSLLTGDGFNDALMATAQFVPFKPAPKEKVWAYENWKPEEQVAALLRMCAAPAAGGMAGAVNLAAQYALNRGAIEQHAQAAKPVDEIRIGGAGFHLTGMLTPQGAGVSELILNHFPEGNRDGLKVPGPDGKPKPLALIPRNPAGPPAFSVFHYAKPGEDEERPLDTLGKLLWVVERTQVAADADRQEVVFAADVPDHGVRIVKTFTLAKGEYHLGLTVKVERPAGAKPGPKFRYQLAGAHGLPIEGEWYTYTYRNAMVGWVDKKDADWRVLQDYHALSGPAGSERFRQDGKRFAYAAVAIQYFASAIVVDDRSADGTPLPADRRNFLEFVRTTLEGSPNKEKPYLDDFTVRAIAEPLDVSPGTAVEHQYLLYHGPAKVELLKQFKGDKLVPASLVNRYAEGLRLNNLTDYPNYGWWSRLILFFTNIMHALLYWLHAVVRNWGVCIILLTVIVRGMLFPVSRRQAANMQKLQEKMQKLAPELKKIEAQHKGDYVAMRQAQAELYRRHNVNPASSLGGCFLLVLQMPIFMGLYYCLQESFFFRQDRFLWIPSLAAPDMLIRWGENTIWPLYYFTHPDYLGYPQYLGPYFNLLPVLSVALMLVQQKMMTPPPTDEQQAMQQKMMKWMMIVFAVLFYRIPSGLTIYFICSTLWGVAERKLLPKKPAVATATGSGPSSDGKAAAVRKAVPKKPPGKFASWWQKVLKEASKK